MQKESIHEALEGLILGPLSGLCTPEDVKALTGLCYMSTKPSGQEDPKALVRSMSNKFIEAVKMNMQGMMKNPIVAPVAQFFFMEWCYRHGHLEEDWHWVWKSANEGDLKYRERIPLRTLAPPS